MLSSNFAPIPPLVEQTMLFIQPRQNWNLSRNECSLNLIVYTFATLMKLNNYFSSKFSIRGVLAQPFSFFTLRSWTSVFNIFPTTSTYTDRRVTAHFHSDQYTLVEAASLSARIRAEGLLPGSAELFSLLLDEQYWKLRSWGAAHRPCLAN